jgi:SAM-dependent methyltransferase
MANREAAAATCPACSAVGMRRFHQQHAVPANSCLLLTSRTEAEGFPTGDMDVAFCESCGFISNLAFDPHLAEYSARYEETQGFSPRFVEFATSLAERWVDTYDLAGRDVLEIGCGKGEFLVLMAEAGIGSGTGMDPTLDLGRLDSQVAANLTWRPELYTDAHAHLAPDAIVCRHTLEHIPDVGRFVRMIRRNIGSRLDTVLLFELPDTRRVLEEVAFWDVYYEHCSYFSEGSLARLFERFGFEILDLRLEYDDQYLILEAKPVPPGAEVESRAVDDIAALASGVDTFASGYDATIARWRSRIAEVAAEGGEAVIWGGGSKGVAFLAVAGEHVEAAVDINPHKHGMYMAGTGHRIVGPAELRDLRPDLVIVMNPIYVDEIGADLAELGLTPEVVAL